MNVFQQAIAEWMIEALQALHETSNLQLSDIGALIEQPPNPDLGDYAVPCFSFARILRKAPPKIASDIVQQLQERVNSSSQFRDVKAVGPYVNFKVSVSYMASLTLPHIVDGSYFNENQEANREKVMIEYSQPNTHKGFHVGHMRNVALGDSLCRIFCYNGYDVVAANYIGDVGTHIAKCLWYYLNHNTETQPDDLRGEWLGELYTKSTLKLEDAQEDEKAQYQREISDILQRLEAKEPEISKIWMETRQWSLEDFNEIYKWLDAQFNHVFYESEVDEAGKQLVYRKLEDGVFQRSEGAIGIDLNDKNLGFFLLLKSDGNTLYSTKDLALAQKKFDEFQIEKSVYIVGAEQTLHFQQVFETLKRMGYEQAEKCFHLPYALVMLLDGKMSSRAGNVILFSQLRSEMTEYIQSNYLNQYRGKWEDEEIEETTRKVAVGAIRYGMLNQDPNKHIIFSMEDWLVSEGDTGTYLIYAYVRIRSIGRQIQRELELNIDFNLLSHPNEQALIRKMFDFNRIVRTAGDQYKPSLLTRYLFELAKEFSRTYNTCSVKFAETSELQAARLILFHCVAETLKKGLNLLGITPPERM